MRNKSNKVKNENYLFFKIIKQPKGMFIIIFIFFIIGTLLFINHVISLSDLILFLTFIVIVYYTYYAHKQIVVQTRLSAVITLESYKLEESKTPGEISNHFYSVYLINHCRSSIKCSCQINVTINEKKPQKLINQGFYSGDSYIEMPPYGRYGAWIDIDRFLKLYDKSYLEFYKNRSNLNSKALKFEIEFNYCDIEDEDNLVKNPKTKYYYDFNLNELVLDI